MGDGQRNKILVIDDEPVVSKVLKARLEANNYEVLTAYDGLSGIEKAEEESPDIILLDLFMPIMDGYEVCRRIKTNPKNKHMPIIIFTAAVQKDLEKRARAVGAIDVIIKPFDTDVLLYMLNRFLLNKLTSDKSDKKATL